MTTYVHLQYLTVIVLYNRDTFNRELRNESEESDDLNVKSFIIVCDLCLRNTYYINYKFAAKIAEILTVCIV